MQVSHETALGEFNASLTGHLKLLGKNLKSHNRDPPPPQKKKETKPKPRLVAYGTNSEKELVK